MPLPLTVSCVSKIQIGFVLHFWYRLTRVVPDKGPINGVYAPNRLLDGGLQHFPRPLAVFRGPTSKRKRWQEKGEKGRETLPQEEKKEKSAPMVPLDINSAV